MPATILVVEDSRFLRIASERALTRAGFTVITSGDGEEALRLAAEKFPDLVLLDMMLPKLGGPEVLQALKNNAITAHIPVIVLSSLPQTNEDRLKHDGAVAYFEKSRLLLRDNTDVLVMAIKETLARSLRS
jgi:CheY-like chemotaxis protein